MRNERIHIVLTLIATLLFANAAHAADDAPAKAITLDTPLEEMMDRSAIARWPDPAYTVKQVSSYDRRSVAPDKPGWFANADASNFIRIEDKGDHREWVMMDEKGPGAIVRWWITAGRFDGTLRIYLDDMETPVIEGNVAEIIGGDALVGKPFSAERARGRNLYLPIPYAKRCKVTYEAPSRADNPDQLTGPFYYQINYRTYEPGTRVETLSLDEPIANRELVKQVAEELTDESFRVTSALANHNTSETLAPDATATLNIKGPCAITLLHVRLQADDMARALRSTVLKVRFDGSNCIWVPVSDFFGSGVGVNAFSDWYRSVEKTGEMTSYWVMPFKNDATIELVNLGEQDVRAKILATAKPWQWNDRSMHFHAAWKQQRNIPTANNGTQAIDFNYVTLKGQGIYVGDTLALLNRHVAWWGEGDEKIYIDGEPFPSHFGTGTEDYYGYAWCTPQVFASPFHAQPRAEGPANAGHVTNTRVRLLDGIPFRESLQVDMEIWHWRKTEVDYAVTTYWYALPGGSSNIKPMPDEAAQPVKARFDMPLAGFKVAGKSGGRVTPQDMRGFGVDVWSNDDHLWWVEAAPGDKLHLTLPVEKAGRYDVKVILTKARDYGIVQFALDDTKLGKPIDLYNEGVIRTKPIVLGTRELEAGEHRLAVEITGANEKAVKAYMFGIDELILEPAE